MAEKRNGVLTVGVMEALRVRMPPLARLFGWLRTLNCFCKLISQLSPSKILSARMRVDVGP